jgi:hypothetical protein
MDFTIENYSTEEIVQILDLPVKKKYHKSELHDAIIKTIECNQNSKVELHERQKLHSFVIEAYKFMLDQQNITYDDLEINQLVHMGKIKEENVSSLQEHNELYFTDVKKTDVKKTDVKKKSIQKLHELFFTKLYVFNSKFRNTESGSYDLVLDQVNSQSSTNFEMQLNTPIPNVVEMRFKSMEFLNSMYTINKTNNTFFIRPSDISSVFQASFNDLIQTKHNGDYPWFKIEIPEGNYIIDDAFNTAFENKIKTDIYDALSSLKSKGILNVTNVGSSSAPYFNFTYNRTNERNKSSINRVDANGNDSNKNFEIMFTNTYQTFSPNEFRNEHLYSVTPMKVHKTLGYILGYRKHHYKDNHMYESESQFESQGTRNFYFVVNDGVNAVGYSDHIHLMDEYGSFRMDNILAKISVYSGSNNIQYEIDNDGLYRTRKYNAPVVINTLKIQVLDDNGEIVNNNNSDFSFTLEFKISSKK